MKFINRIPQSLGEKSGQAGQSVQEGLRALQSIQEHVDQVSSVLEDAIQSVTRSSAGVNDVAASMHEQGKASNEVARNIESIAQMAEQNHAAAERL